MARATLTRFVSIPKAAAELGYSVSTLRKWVREKRLTIYRASRTSHPRVRLAEVEALLSAERDLPVTTTDPIAIFTELARQWDKQHGKTRKSNHSLH